ncbi:glucose-6-phosphate dehydrogenase [Clostridium oryzae]|uniref:Glucose-6-phosphate 1-dehydrogenase n=1 Tax=Clostridium oryzae TaxID=1450648 RepID=A0A1V4I9G1_9CLOT|nr:glucose-6-phosphate dehydrogenase [Clostridium oryzae]OPJ56157.1 glucose-6-phosphate 1-dehydrogenase [Clostridium oryzae]
MNKGTKMPSIVVIFGGTGDLTHRKLMPSLYNLFHQRQLPDSFAIVSVGRKDFSDEEYREQVRISIEKFTRFKLTEDVWSIMRERIYYVRFNFSDDGGYVKLKNILEEMDDKYNTNGNRTYYLAVSPEYFAVIVDKLKHHDMALSEKSIRRLVIEKPFGKDLSSAEELNDKITRVFTEDNVYRIDHYLGKEMIQNIMVLRFSNPIFGHLWNNNYIDNVQITSSETVGVENRGGYYENAGALKDMIQNHLFQLLTLIAMEAPVNLDTKSIRDEKIKILKAIKHVDEDFVRHNMVRGQYGPGEIGINKVNGYRQEEKVAPDSDVETFVAMKVFVDNFRWAGVPFYLRTGKRMKNKTTEIVIQFKELPKILYARENNLVPNLLIIKVQPMEGVIFQFNAKKPGTGNEIVPVKMDFCQNCQMENNSPEAYERLISDVLKGDSTLFTRWDEVEYSWRFVDKIISIWKNSKEQFPNYVSGTWGPEASQELLSRDNRQWWEI